MRRRPLAERHAYEEQMLSWVALGEGHGLTDEQSMAQWSVPGTAVSGGEVRVCSLRPFHCDAWGRRTYP
jgi:hypothetical protein